MIKEQHPKQQPEKAQEGAEKTQKDVLKEKIEAARNINELLSAFGVSSARELLIGISQEEIMMLSDEQQDWLETLTQQQKEQWSQEQRQTDATKKKLEEKRARLDNQGQEENQKKPEEIEEMLELDVLEDRFKKIKDSNLSLHEKKAQLDELFEEVKDKINESERNSQKAKLEALQLLIAKIIEEQKKIPDNLTKQEQQEQQGFKELSNEELEKLSPEKFAAYQAELEQRMQEITKRREDIAKEKEEVKSAMQIEMEKIQNERIKRKFFAYFKRNQYYQKLVAGAGYLSGKAKEGLSKFKGTKFGKSVEKNTKKAGKSIGVVAKPVGKSAKWLYEKYKWAMHSENKWKRLGKRIIFSGFLGTVTGGGSIVVTAISGLSGIAAGTLYEKATKKKLQKNIERIKGTFVDEQKRHAKDYVASLAANRELLKDLRRRKREEFLGEEESALFEKLEKERLEKVEKIKATLANIKEEKERLIEDLKKQNAAGAATATAIASIITGLGLNYGPRVLNKVFDTDFANRFGLMGNSELKHAIHQKIDSMHDSIQHHPLDKTIHNGESPVSAGTEHAGTEHAGTEHAGTEHAGTEHAGTEHAGTEHAGTEHAGTEHAGTAGHEVVKGKPIPSVERITNDHLVHKGEGYTHVMKRIIAKDPALRKYFHIEGTKISGEKLKEIAQKLGYINKEDGSWIGVLDKKGVGLDIRFVDGKPTAFEFAGGHMEHGKYVDGHLIERHPDGSLFEGKDNIESVERVGQKNATEYFVDGNQHHYETSHTGNVDHTTTHNHTGNVEHTAQQQTTTGNHQGASHHETHTTHTQEYHTNSTREAVSEGHVRTPLIEGDPREIGTPYGDHIYSVEIGHGTTAFIQYNESETNIVSILYKNYDGQDYNLMIDKHGDGLIDRFIEKNSDIHFEEFKDMPIEKILRDPTILAKEGFNHDRYTKLIDFGVQDGKEVVTTVKVGFDQHDPSKFFINNSSDPNDILKAENEIFEKMHLTRPSQEALDAFYAKHEVAQSAVDNTAQGVHEGVQHLGHIEKYGPFEVADGKVVLSPEAQEVFAHPGHFSKDALDLLHRTDGAHYSEIFSAGDKFDENGGIIRGMKIVRLDNGEYAMSVEDSGVSESLARANAQVRLDTIKENFGLSNEKVTMTFDRDGTLVHKIFVPITKEQAQYFMNLPR